MQSGWERDTEAPYTMKITRITSARTPHTAAVIYNAHAWPEALFLFQSWPLLTCVNADKCRLRNNYNKKFSWSHDKWPRRLVSAPKIIISFFFHYGTVKWLPPNSASFRGGSRHSPAAKRLFAAFWIKICTFQHINLPALKFDRQGHENHQSESDHITTPLAYSSQLQSQWPRQKIETLSSCFLFLYK